MTKNLLIFYFSISLILPISTSSLSPCSTEQISQFLTKCGPLEKDLVSLREFAGIFFDAEKTVRNMTDVCEKIENCYGSIHCQESFDKNRAVQEKCEMDRYMFGRVPKCLKWFYKEAWMKANFTCVKEYDFLSYNLTAKRDAFISGESCVHQVLNKSQNSTCDSESVDFITSNYAKIVDFISVDRNPKNQSCEGPHATYGYLQCRVLQDLWFKKHLELTNSKFYTKSQLDYFSTVTDKFLECMAHSCRFPEKLRKDIEFQRKLYMLTNDENEDCLYDAKRLIIVTARVTFCHQKWYRCELVKELCVEDTAVETEELLNANFENTTISI